MNDREEFILLQTLQPVEAGQEFQQIPPHMTTVPWFSVPRESLDDLVPVLDDLVEKHGKDANFATGIELVNFGPNEDIPACRVLVGTVALNASVVGWVDRQGGTFKYETYARKWRPHITHEQGVEVKVHDLVLFSTLALVSRQDTETEKRKVVEYAAQLPVKEIWRKKERA
jgi:hypothetical protein